MKIRIGIQRVERGYTVDKTTQGQRAETTVFTDEKELIKWLTQVIKEDLESENATD